MGTYLYAVAATGRKKVDFRSVGFISSPITVFPLVYRWKYGATHVWNEYNRQDFHIARIERNAKRAVANPEYQGFVALYGVRKGGHVYYADKDLTTWADQGDKPIGEFIGYLDQRIEDGSWFVSPVDPTIHHVYERVKEEQA